MCTAKPHPTVRPTVCSSEFPAARQRTQYFAHNSPQALGLGPFPSLSIFSFFCACVEHHLMQTSLVAASSPAPCAYVCRRRPFHHYASALVPACLHPTLSIVPTQQVQPSRIHPLLVRCSRVCAVRQLAGSRASCVYLYGVATARGAMLCGATVDEKASTCQLCSTTEPTLSVFCHRQWHTVFDGILSAHHLPSVAPLCMSLSNASLPSSQVLSQRPSTVPVRLVSAALLVGGWPVEACGCACLGWRQGVAHCFTCVALPFSTTLLPESISLEPACGSCHQQVRRGLNPRSAATDQHVRFFAHFSCQVLPAVRDALVCMCCDWFSLVPVNVQWRVHRTQGQTCWQAKDEFDEQRLLRAVAGRWRKVCVHFSSHGCLDVRSTVPSMGPAIITCILRLCAACILLACAVCRLHWRAWGSFSRLLCTLTHATLFCRVNQVSL